MKIATIVIRVLLGALMIFASVSYFFNLGEQPKPEGTMATIMSGFMATGYLFPLVKGVELLAGLSLLIGKFDKLFNLVLLPVSVNIFLLNAYQSKENLLIGTFVLLSNLFLIYRNWDSYKEIVKP
jgi:uncharacterized membrane protein YphA (DoxX/SURF4 family)